METSGAGSASAGASSSPGGVLTLSSAGPAWRGPDPSRECPENLAGPAQQAITSRELQTNRAPTALGDRGPIIMIPDDSGQGVSGSPGGSVTRTFSEFELWVHLGSGDLKYELRFRGSTN